MESDKQDINEKGLKIESSIDPYTNISDLKKLVLLKYSNRDLFLSNLKNDLIMNGRTLFYPYCYRSESLDFIKDLNYQNFIFSDSRFKEYSYKESYGGKKRFLFVDLDPLMIIEILLSLELNIHIDCFIGIKDEIHSDDYTFLLEMSIPLLTDSLIYVGSQMNKVGKFRVIDKFTKKLPYKHKQNIDSDYFNFFTNNDLNDIYRIFGSKYDVIHFETKSKKSKVFIINGIRIYLVHDSIFQYLSGGMMDLCFVEYENDFQQTVVNLNYNHVFDVRGHYIRDDDVEFHLFNENDILYLCRSLKSKKICFTKNWKNAEQIRVLTIYPSSVTDIYVFCTDLEDFNELYLQRFDEIDDDDF